MPCGSSRRTGCSSARARRPTPAAWRPRHWRCSRTPAATRGASSTPRSGSRPSCATSTRAAPRPPRSTGGPATTSSVPTSPASSRWPTRCWPRVSSDRRGRATMTGEPGAPDAAPVDVYAAYPASPVPGAGAYPGDTDGEVYPELRRRRPRRTGLGDRRFRPPEPAPAPEPAEQPAAAKAQPDSAPAQRPSQDRAGGEPARRRRLPLGQSVLLLTVGVAVGLVIGLGVGGPAPDDWSRADGARDNPFPTGTAVVLEDYEVRLGEPATVLPLRPDAKAAPPTGAVTFVVDGRPVHEPVTLDRRGRATMMLHKLEKGLHRVRAEYGGG